GGGAVLGSAPVAVLGDGEDPFAVLDRVPVVEDGVGDGFVGGGWGGYLGYELRRAVDAARTTPPSPPPPGGLPEAALAYYDHVLRRDGDGRWWFEALVTPEREAALDARLAELRARLAGTPPAAPEVSVSDWAWTPAPDGHARAVAACVQRIVAGDL